MELRSPFTQAFFSPWDEMDRMRQEFQKLLSSSARQSLLEFPAVNIWSNDDQALLTAELPGIDTAKLEITVQNDTVTIRGNREVQTLGKDETCLRQERESGSFTRSFALPFRVNPDQVSAKYARGILEVTLPRLEEEKPKKITVKAA